MRIERWLGGRLDMGGKGDCTGLGRGGHKTGLGGGSELALMWQATAGPDLNLQGTAEGKATASR